MKCIHCSKEAQAVCRFCGRAVCGEHIQNLNYIAAVYTSAQQRPQALVIADAVYCGICKPQPEPLDAPFLG